VAKLEDCPSDFSDCRVKIVNNVAHALSHLLSLGQPDRTFEKEACGEQPLYDVVVQFHGYAISVFQHAENAHPVVEPSVLDSDTGGKGQCLGQSFVLVAKFAAAVFVGQIQVPPYLTGSNPDGNP
jgi:hypothetical protein